MLFSLFASAFGAYIATSGIRADIQDISAKLTDINYNIIAVKAEIAEASAHFDSRIDKLELQHEAIYKMVEWGVYLQSMQMHGGKYIGNDIYRVVENKDTSFIDLSRQSVEEHHKHVVFKRDFRSNREYINGRLVHEFRNKTEFVYDLEGSVVYTKEPYHGTWRETWFYPDGSERMWRVDDVTRCFDEQGNVTCWNINGESLLKD